MANETPEFVLVNPDNDVTLCFYDKVKAEGWCRDVWARHRDVSRCYVTTIKEYQETTGKGIGLGVTPDAP